MSLKSIRNKNKNLALFSNDEINPGTLSSEDVRKIKEDVFYKLVKPVNYRTFSRLKTKSLSVR